MRLSKPQLNRKIYKYIHASSNQIYVSITFSGNPYQIGLHTITTPFLHSTTTPPTSNSKKEKKEHPSTAPYSTTALIHPLSPQPITFKKIQSHPSPAIARLFKGLHFPRAPTRTHYTYPTPSVIINPRRLLPPPPPP